jgi:methionyl-tRNA synthetase
MRDAPSETRYVTTPIYYVNDRPHIGHVYTTTVADVFARYHRSSGRDVFFLTGTDEHATKVVDAARERGLTAQQWADQNAAAFRQVFVDLKLSNDDFIRTTEPRHKEKVVEYFQALLKSGDVYLGDYSGWYDAGQEEYVPESKAREYNFKSPINGKPLVQKTESNYFFRLSAYRQALQEHFASHPEFVRPEPRRNEILNRIAEAEDVPISRTGMGDWGIKVPGDELHTIYVWIDALFNYLTTVDTPNRRHYWSSGPVHLLAKDILWFHAAIWPAMLIALRKCPGYDWVVLPRLVYAHSFWISEGQKMSKSLGNFIDLPTISQYVETYSIDALRYYLITQGPLGAQDANFAAAHFHEVYSTDLVNTIGNCASRVTAMIGRYFEGVIPSPPTVSASNAGSSDFDWPATCAHAAARCTGHYERMELAEAASEAIGLIRRIDAFINATEPFKIAKDAARKDELAAILYKCAEALRIASTLLSPLLPFKMRDLWQALGLAVDDATKLGPHQTAWGGLKPGTRVQKVALFPRVELKPEPAAVAVT